MIYLWSNGYTVRTACSVPFFIKVRPSVMEGRFSMDKMYYLIVLY